MNVFLLFFSRKAFQLYYKEFVEVSCPTEDIYLEWPNPAFDHSPVQYTVS